MDETADIELAGRKIYEGASFDNNILCFAEKEVFAVNTAYDGLLHELQKQGAYLLNKAQTEQLVNIVLQPKKGGGHEVNKSGWARMPPAFWRPSACMCRILAALPSARCLPTIRSFWWSR